MVFIFATQSGPKLIKHVPSKGNKLEYLSTAYFSNAFPIKLAFIVPRLQAPQSGPNLIKHASSKGNSLECLSTADMPVVVMYF